MIYGLINDLEPKGLTHWGRVTHICVSKLTTLGSVNGLSPGRRQAIIWTNDGILLIRTLGTNFSETLSKIQSFLFKKMHLKLSSAKWRLFRLSLNELKRSGEGINTRKGINKYVQKTTYFLGYTRKKGDRYNACWCPGSMHPQAISSHDADSQTSNIRCAKSQMFLVSSWSCLCQIH